MRIQSRTHSSPVALTVLYVLSGLMLAGMGVYHWFLLMSLRSLAEVQEALYKDGVPRSPAALQAPLPPPARNAAPLYQQMTHVLGARPISTEAADLLWDRWSDYTPQEIAGLRRVLENRRDLVDLAEQASVRPDCVFSRNWALGPDLPLPEYKTMRWAARLLSARSYLLARQGRFQEAVSSQERVFSIARHAGAEPHIISYLVSIACDSLALAGMQHILLLAGPDPATAGAVRQAIAADRPTFHLRVALGGEVVMLSAGLKKFADTPKKLDGFESELNRLFGPKVARFGDAEKQNQIMAALEVPLLQDMHRLILAADRPFPECLVLFRKVNPRTDSQNPFLILRDEWLREMARAASPAGLAHAKEEIIETAALLLIYRARHGMFPARLQDLVARPPLDPFTGQPLLYRREPGGFVIYSVGEKGHFNVGRPGVKIDSHESGFRYPLPTSHPPH